jgi:N-acetylglutamate synthase-like GNAT family acetyltransferase
MIRSATINDVDQFSELARRFAAESNRKRFSRDTFVSSWKQLLEAGMGHIYGRFVDNVPRETIAVLTYNDPFDGYLCASVAFWHFENESVGLEGGMLFRDMVADLKARNVKELFYSALFNQRFAKVSGFLAASSFEPVEMIFKKEL